VYVTAKTPPDVLAALRTAVGSMMASGDMRDRLAAMGAEPQSGSSDEMRALLRREVTVWTKVIQESAIKIQ